MLGMDRSGSSSFSLVTEHPHPHSSTLPAMTPSRTNISRQTSLLGKSIAPVSEREGALRDTGT